MSGHLRRGSLETLVRTRVFYRRTVPGEEEDGPVTVRAFASGSGTMLWEAKNFYTTGRSPNNTLWGWGVRKITPIGYTRRVIHEVPVVSTATMPGDSPWPAKTNPANYGTGRSTVAIDLLSITSAGVKSTLVADWLVYTGTRSASGGSLMSDLPVGTYTTAGAKNYHANNSGLVMNVSLQSLGAPTLPYGGSGASIVIQDPALNGTVMKMTIRADAIIKHVSAGANVPQWFFRRASTNATFPLYATPAQVITALQTLPGVTSVTATGGPCCEAAMNVEITWAAAANTFSDAWISFSSKATGRRVITDWTDGTPSHIMTIEPITLTSDGTGIIRGPGDDGIVSRRNLTAPTSNPFGANGASVWSTIPFNGLSQTNERTKVGAGTTWTAVPRFFSVADVREGIILMQQTRGRTPVVEPSGNAMTTHATLNESTGAIIASHDAHLNGMARAFLTESGSLAVNANGQYAFAYQGGDEGVATPPGNSFDASLGSFPRCHSGRIFATGTGSMFEPFATEADVFAASNSYTFSANLAALNVGKSSGQNWTFETIGERSSFQHRSAGRYVTCSWVTFAAGTPDPVLPAHEREAWLTFASPEWMAVPSNLEYRYVHRTGSTNHKTTAWFAVGATTADVNTELQLWYGEPIAGYPTISIVGTVEAHTFQSQPWWQYMPLAHIAIWNDATGATFSPRGRLLGLEFRNGTAAWTRSIVSMSRTTGVIGWQKNAGLSDPAYNSVDSEVGGSALYATDTQLVVHTLCLPVVQAAAP